MADNKVVDNGGLTDIPVATDEVTYSGDTADIQLLRPVHVTGAEGAKTVVEITSANGQWVEGSLAHDAADAGNPIKIGGKASDTPPTAVTANDRVNAWFKRDGSQVMAPQAASTATGSNVNDSASSAQLVAANDARKGLAIYNDSPQDLFIKYGTTASLTDFLTLIPPYSLWVMVKDLFYTGRVDGIWRADASGAARITEL